MQNKLTLFLYGLEVARDFLMKLFFLAQNVESSELIFFFIEKYLVVLTRVTFLVERKGKDLFPHFPAPNSTVTNRPAVRFPFGTWEAQTQTTAKSLIFLYCR